MTILQALDKNKVLHAFDFDGFLLLSKKGNILKTYNPYSLMTPFSPEASWKVVPKHTKYEYVIRDRSIENYRLN